MTDEKPNMDGVLRRVKKLLAIANDSRADPNEAAAAAGQAEKIMRKYQLDNADVLREEMRSAEAFETADVQVLMRRGESPEGFRPSKIPGWGGWLAYSVAKLHGCEIRYVNLRDKGAAIRFYGFKADVQVAAWTFDYLVVTTIQALRAWQRVSRTKAESESYRRGFALAVCGLIDKQTMLKRQDESAAQAQAPTRNALVLVKAASLAEKYGDFNYGDASPSKANLVGSAYIAGREAGSKVRLTQGIGANSSDRVAIK